MQYKHKNSKQSIFQRGLDRGVVFHFELDQRYSLRIFQVSYELLLILGGVNMVPLPHMKTIERPLNSPYSVPSKSVN